MSRATWKILSEGENEKKVSLSRWKRKFFSITRLDLTRWRQKSEFAPCCVRKNIIKSKSDLFLHRNFTKNQSLNIKKVRLWKIPLVSCHFLESRERRIIISWRKSNERVENSLHWINCGVFVVSVDRRECQVKERENNKHFPKEIHKIASCNAVIHQNLIIYDGEPRTIIIVEWNFHRWRCRVQRRWKFN